MNQSDAAARARIRQFFPPIAFILISIPLVLNLIPPNRWYGFRTRETMVSDEVWYSSNRLGAFALIAASAVWLAAATYLPSRYVKPVGVVAVVVAIVLLFVTQGWSI